MSIRRVSLSALGLITTTALLAACSTPADNSAATSFPESPVVTTETSTVEAEEGTAEPTTVEATTEDAQGLSPLGSPNLEDKQSTPASDTDLIPKGVRVADHGSFTRVVLDFEGPGEAGWFTSLTDEPAQQGSGFPVDYEGTTAINVGIESTPWPSTPEREEAFMDYGTTDGAGVVTGVEFVSTFEAQSQYVIGLEEEAAYSVTFLEGPPRVVIDVVN